LKKAFAWPDSKLIEALREEEEEELEALSAKYELEDTNKQDNKEKIHTSDAQTQTDEKNEKPSENMHNNKNKELDLEVPGLQVPPNLVQEMIERLRNSTELSHGMCKLAIETVIDCVREMIPGLGSTCKQIVNELNEEDLNISNMHQSADTIKFNSVFQKLSVSIGKGGSPLFLLLWHLFALHSLIDPMKKGRLKVPQ